MQKMKLRGLVRTSLFGCLAVFGLEVFASGGVVGKPNLLEGGYVYYYGTTDGNAPWYTCSDNVYGRIPHQVEDYIPPMGRTNAIFLARSESFSVPTNYECVGTSIMGNSRSTSGSTGNVTYSLDGTGTRVVFKMKDSVYVSPEETTYTYSGPSATREGGSLSTLCFRHALGDGTYERCMLQIYHVNRSDAFYRIPRGNDTYYVKPGTTLWFCDFDKVNKMLWSPWANLNGEALTADWACDKWSFVKCTAKDTANHGYFDKFTITAEPNETVVLQSVDGTRQVTVHVVGDDFRFTSHVLLFKYGNDAAHPWFETRKLSTILSECQEPYALSDIASVVSVDGEKGVAVEKDAATGDYSLTPLGYHDFDRYVTVTLTGGRGVILLKITSLTGRCDETLCARVMPKWVYGKDFKNLILNNSGNIYTPPEWEVCTSPNAPPGYTDIRRTPACVLYEGKRYSLYAACKSELTQNTGTPAAGQTRCVYSLRKVVAWLEDLDGNLVSSPALCIGNCGYSDLHATRFCLGTANCLYTNDPGLTNLVRGTHAQFCDEYYQGTTVTQANKFQGAPADDYGYCAMLACAADKSYGQTPWIDEMTVFLVSDVRTVTVTKEVVGDDSTTRFPFVETHDIYDDKAQIVTVTNTFGLADGESWSFAVVTGGCARVTELTPTNYEASVRISNDRTFRAGNEFAVSNLMENVRVDFRNDGTRGVNPVSLWITDHADAGSNKVHLAFDPDFGDQSVSLGSWLERARAQDAIHTRHAPFVEALEKAAIDPVEYRDGTGDRDVDSRHWVWITPDVSETTNVNFLVWQILVDPLRGELPAYVDETLSCSIPEERFAKTQVDASTALYAFTDPAEAAAVEIKRNSRVKSLLLVGGGGGGGAAQNATSNGGGGGGGGEVRLIEVDQLGLEFLAKGQTLWLDVGKGGAPSSLKYLPGDNGEATSFTCGDLTWSALGGGGGGSNCSDGDLKYYGAGSSGANGGGGAYNANGGATTNGIGSAGGKADTGAGGGGGMTAAGATGSSNQSGNGGEGVVLTIAGRTAVYGAGGGGGGKTSTSTKPLAGLGGTNAGDGAYAREGLVNGEDAPAGFGGGGGGGGVVGGRGGNGAVIVELQDASTIDAVTTVGNVSVFLADLTATLKSFTGKGTSSAVYFAMATGSDDFVFGNEPIATGVVPGNAVPHTVQDLWSDTDYRYAFKFVDDLGNELVTSGTFHTDALDFPVGYEDDYVIVRAGVDVKVAGGEYLISAGKAITNAEAIVKRDILLQEALVVGGGGAGGSVIGGGGGGGGVVYSNAVQTLVAGTKFLMTVGAGGVSKGTTQYIVNGDGLASSLSIGDAVYACALGGGAGASLNENSGKGFGHDGANGGGGTKINGRGGSPTVPEGHRGGATSGEKRQPDNNDSLAGGGAGAGADGENGMRIAGTTDRNKAGDGGIGVTNLITGTAVVYGSGGGGGGDSYIDPGMGGSGAGDGAPKGGVAGDGVDGTGGGAGGAGYNSNGSRGGRGGDGAVIFKLLKNDAAYGSAEVLSVDYRAATLVGTLLTVREGETTASIAFSYAPEGQPLEGAGLAEQVAEGTALTNRLTGLAFGTTYAYRYDFITADGALTNSVGGTFHVETGYEDANAVITGVPNDYAPTPKEGTLGVYAFTAAGTQGRLVLKGEVDVNPLTVADGSTVRAFGPDGREIDLTEDPILLPEGTEITFAVGEGSDGVSLTLKERSPIEARVRVQDARPFVVTLTAEMLAIGETADSAEVRFGYAPRGETISTFVGVTNGLVAGDVATIRIPDLDPDTEYDYEIRLTDGDNAKSIAGFFKSAALDFTPGYEDDFVVVNGSVAAGDLRVIDNGDEKVYVFTNVARNARLLVRRDNVAFAEAVVVGGGGGGGYLLGGGGGGGGVVQQSAVAVLNCEQELAVVIGAGGAGSTSQKSSGVNGGDSSLTIVGGEPMVANGGGGGASWQSFNGSAGGCGGGGGGGYDNGKKPGVGGAGTDGQGFAGGSVYHNANKEFVWCPGGGGGAETVGESGHYDSSLAKDCSGKGGEGRTLDITGEDVVYGSGGGGGGGGDSNHLCAFGEGGTNGGNGGNPAASASAQRYGQPGVNGTGGGGGGGSFNNNTDYSNGGRGGNGTVIIRLRVGN